MIGKCIRPQWNSLSIDYYPHEEFITCFYPMKQTKFE